MRFGEDYKDTNLKQVIPLYFTGVYNIYNRRKNLKNSHPYWPSERKCAYVHTLKRPEKIMQNDCNKGRFSMSAGFWINPSNIREIAWLTIGLKKSLRNLRACFSSASLFGTRRWWSWSGHRGPHQATANFAFIWHTVTPWHDFSVQTPNLWQ